MNTSLPFKWSTDFVLGNDRVALNVEVSDRNHADHRYVSFTGSIAGDSGQIVDILRQRAAIEGAEDVIELCDAWDALHFKSVKDLTKWQIAKLEKVNVTLQRVAGKRYGQALAFEDLDDAKFSNTTDVIDSRDVIERIELLTGAFVAAGLDPEKLPDDADEIVRDFAEELNALRALEAAASHCGDWPYGAALVRESYFEEYAQEFADDIGAIDLRNAPWPLQHIDWEAAASALKMDYAAVDYDGVTYWIRS